MSACRRALQRVALKMLRFIEATATARAGGQQAFVSVGVGLRKETRRALDGAVCQHTQRWWIRHRWLAAC